MMVRIRAHTHTHACKTWHGWFSIYQSGISDKEGQTRDGVGGGAQKWTLKIVLKDLCKRGRSEP
jgi:hypothetical protein